MTVSVCFGVDWESVTPDEAAQVPLTVADASGELHTVRDRNGKTPIYWAAEYSTNPDVIAALVRAGADPDGDANIWGSPFEAAVQHENAGAVKALIAAGCGVNAFWVAEHVRSREMVGVIAEEADDVDWEEHNDDFRTPLQVAVLACNASAVGVLIKHGAETYAPEGEESVLHLAARESGNGAVVKILIEDGIDVNCLDDEGLTPLSFAMGDTADELRKAGGYECDESKGECFGVNWKAATPADVAKIKREGNIRNRGGQFFGMPIHWAARFCSSPEVITALADIDAGINAESYEYSRHEVMEGGSFYHRRDKEQRKAPLHLAAEYNTHPGVVEALIKVGADVDAVVDEHMPNSPFNGGWTPLHYAVTSGNLQAVVRLIRAGADLDVVTACAQRGTPLNFALQCRRTRKVLIRPEIICELVKAGANAHARGEFPNSLSNNETSFSVARELFQQCDSAEEAEALRMLMRAEFDYSEEE